MTGCKETQCTRCSHREVCALKNDFLMAQEAVDSVLVKLDSNGIGVKISNMTFIYPVELKCRHYYAVTETARSYSMDATTARCYAESGSTYTCVN